MSQLWWITNEPTHRHARTVQDVSENKRFSRYFGGCARPLARCFGNKDSRSFFGTKYSHHM